VAPQTSLTDSAHDVVAAGSGRRGAPVTSDAGSSMQVP